MLIILHVTRANFESSWLQCLYFIFGDLNTDGIGQIYSEKLSWVPKMYIVDETQFAGYYSIRPKKIEVLQFFRSTSGAG